MLEIAMMFDVDWMKGQSAGIFVVKNASPTELIGELQQVFQSKGQGSGLVRFEPVNRLNAILVLTQKSHLLDKVSQWIDRLDRNGVEGDNYYVYRVENAKAKDLAEILNATFSSGGSQLRSAEEDEVAPNRSAAQFSSPVFAEPTMAETGSGSANTAHEGTGLTTASGSTSSTISSGSRSRISASSDEVRITPDEINNKLLIKAPGRIYRKILGVLYRIDQPPLQVLINATLAEVTLNDNLQYGVQFFLQRKDGDGGTLGFSNGSQIEIEPTAPGLNFIVGSTNTTPKVILDALATETNVRVVSSPSVVVLHNQAATLQVGDEVPVATRRVSSATDSQAPLINEIEFRNTGVILQVTPRINSNGLVTMEIQQEISSVTSAATVGDGGDLTPTISQRRIASTIAVQNGQMVVLGGLISEQSNVDKNRVPIIRNIPYLGDIVGSTDSGKIRKELIVFLQPKIIKEPKDAAQIAEELRSRMESLAPRPNLGAALFK